MPDDLDRAKDIEIRQRDDALAATLDRQPEPEQLHNDDGKVLCIDCLLPIPDARLNAKPCAARCIECKSAHEQQQKLRR